jgi:hypothetical protein
VERIDEPNGGVAEAVRGGPEGPHYKADLKVGATIEAQAPDSGGLASGA